MQVFAQSIVNNVKNLIIVCNEYGKVMYVNPYTLHFFGIDASTNLITTKQYLAKINTLLFELNLSVKEYTDFETTISLVKGGVKKIRWSITKDEDKNYIGIGYDITTEKLIEQKLIEKQLKLEHQQEELISSLAYAQKIQQSILPDLEKIKGGFNQVSLLYKPRDIVSGDFYWTTKSNGYSYIAVADCTGHGVPGAMMAMMGTAFLNSIVNKKGVLSCNQILYELDRELHLNVNYKTYGTRDGMDILLIKIDVNDLCLEFSGALRNLYILRNQQLIELKGASYPIGFYDGIAKEFTNVYFKLQNGDKIYMLTDGYTDQFGVEKDKKFKKKKVVELITETGYMELTEQINYMEYVHQNWKQNKEQTDDITVLAIEV